MKKQKRNKKIGFDSVMKDMRETIIKVVINSVVIVIFIAVTFVLTKAYLYRSDYFRLSRIEIKNTFMDQKSLGAIKIRLMNTYKNKSVFSLDLKSIAQALQASYPDAKDISVSLALPDKLVLSLKLRRPVALVSAEKLYPVDEEGVILPIADTTSLKWVPIVSGVQIRPNERKAKVITSRNLKVAIDLLRTMKDVRPIVDYGVASVDTKDLSNISFYLRNGVEIRMGSENFRERLAVLAKTLKDPRLIMERIKYIDLRFGDAIIGPR